MELNIFILVICLLALIYISYYIKQKNIAYFLIVIILFLSLKKYTENFESATDSELEAINKLDEAVNEKKVTNELQSRVGDLENNIEDLKNIIKAQNIYKQMNRGEEAKAFSMTESQKRQDSDLESLEKEVDILLKLYEQENYNNNKDKYKTLPVYSSCKVQDQGSKYMRSNYDSRTTQQLVRQLEKADTEKNLGLNSDSANELFNLINQDGGQNIDVNFNLL
tara:strand:- start:794 stop:1462 length:669 start_codon:yes stop_codon:yes gene_type:complete